MEEEQKLINPELQMLLNNRESGYTYRQRRHDDWEKNYTLYRDKVIINRLIQRQSVNLPIMKQAIRTLLKDVDDMPVLYFENLDNDKQAEIFKNEYWKYTVEQNNMDLQDIVDKRQVFLFGRSFDQWQIIDGKIKQTICDPQHILVSRYVDPTNLHSSRFLIHQHIFDPLSKLEQNPMYDKAVVKRLKQFYATKMGLVKAEDNLGAFQEQNEKMADMGLEDLDDPVLGETYVELTLYFVYRDNEETEDADGNKVKVDEQLYMYVVAEDMEILMKKPLEEVIGTTSDHFWRNHFPYESWADDVERQDFWSDSTGDIIRNPNEVANVWWSQEVERRTLSNFGMNIFDSGMEGFNPGSFNPQPWGWYGLPVGDGKTLKDVYQKVDIPKNDGNLEALQYIQGIADRASGATATQQGEITSRKVTLGEVELALGEAKERVKGMSKFYTPAWQRRGVLFSKLIEAAPDKLDAVKVYKKGRNTDDIYMREIAPKDWMTKSGYRCKVWSLDEKNTADTNTLQKLAYAKSIMPGNPKLEEIHERKSLEFSGLTPDEINEIMQYQKEKRQAIASAAGGMGGLGGMTQPGMMQPNPMQQASPVIN